MHCMQYDDDDYCCGYFDPELDNKLRAQSVPYPCRSLLFQGELYGFVFPRIDFVFKGERCGGV